MTVHEIAKGLWRWTVRHPEWRPDQDGLPGWSADVGCVYYEGADAVVLVDPLTPAEPRHEERFWNALDGDVERLALPIEILLTTHWHLRSAAIVRDRYRGVGARIRAAAGFVDRLDVPDVVAFEIGERLPGGIVGCATSLAGQVVFWIPDHRALVPGDVLLGPGSGTLRLCPDAWLQDPSAPDTLRTALLALLDLPIEMVLVSHGEPVLADGRAALARALV